MNTAVQFQTLHWGGRVVEIEYVWIHPLSPPAPFPLAGEGPGERAAHAPLIVFLHEGLGSVAMWRDFPQQLCMAVGARGLVYSRPGYGRSTPRAADETWDTDFMHRQAYEVLPALLDALGVQERVWLLGHSDGGSIALLHAGHCPQRVAGVVVLAPHIFVEDISIAAIERARLEYANGDLRARLAKYHDDPDSPFGGWNRIWLYPRFRPWNITDEVRTIRCPIVAIQGLDDAYGTLAQIRGIAECVPDTTLLELPQCGHSPHKDQPQAVIAAMRAFIQKNHWRQR